jgi:hypothetical protein
MNDNVGYNGNSLVKKAGIEHEFTPEQIKEIYKCSTDIIYFVSNYCKIITLDKGLQLFEPFEYQKRMLETFSKDRFVINLLPRQMGKSTVVAAYLLHYAMFNVEPKNIGILANKAATSREILSRIQRMYENLPLWMQLGVKEWNKGSMILANDSKIIAAATSSDSIRGLSLNIIYLDEFAHVNQQIEFWESTYPVISSGESSKVIITSTPNGMDLFYKLYKEAEERKNNFTPIKVHWSEHPRRDEKWKEETLKNIGYEQFKQEFEVEFLGSSGTLISGDKLKTLSPSNPIAQLDGLLQYERSVKGHTYAMVVDVSRGKGLDYSAFSVIDVTSMPYKQVCTFKDNFIGPVDYAATVHRVAKTYNEAYVLIEVNDIGGQVSDILFLDYGYENIVFTESAGRAGKRVSGGFGKNVDRGIRTTKSVKNIGCSILKMLVEQNQLIIPDFNTIQELSRFSKKANSYEAESGSHDDLVMTLVLFSWFTDQTYFKDITDIHTMMKLREKTEEQIDEELLPFGFIDDGRDAIEEYMPPPNFLSF